jgi:hypothetical protein
VLASHVPEACLVTFLEERKDAQSWAGPGSARERVLSREVWLMLEQSWVILVDGCRRPAGREGETVVVAQPLLARTSSKASDFFLCQSSQAQAQTNKI